MEEILSLFLMFLECFSCADVEIFFKMLFRPLLIYSVNRILLIDFQMLIQPYIPGMNFTWMCFVTLFIHCWIGFATILLMIFASVLMKGLDLHFFPCNICLIFGIRVMLTSHHLLGGISFFSIFWESLYRIVLFLV